MLNKMIHRPLGRVLWCVLLVALLGAACTPRSTVPPTATPADNVTFIAPAKAIQDIELVNFDKQPAKASDMKGKYTLLTFGYTHCPDVCPATLGVIKQVKMKLGDSANDVNYLYISVDSPRDTPDVLKSYLALFDPSFMGWTGTDENLQKFIKEFGGLFLLENAGGLKKENYTVQHTAGMYLLNKDAQWVRKYAYGIDPSVIVQDMVQVMGVPAATKAAQAQ